MRPKLAFKTDPAGGRMRVIKVCRFAVESLAPMLFFKSPVRNADMGLAGCLAFFQRIHGYAPKFSISDDLNVAPFANSTIGRQKAQAMLPGARDNDSIGWIPMKTGKLHALRGNPCR